LTNKLLYKKGYLIRVTSWENDADNYKTAEMHLPTEEGMKQAVEFAKLFEESFHGGGIGNIHGDYHSEEIAGALETLQKFYEKYPNFFDETPENPEYVTDWLMEVAHDLGLSGGEWFTRVCDKIEVYRFDQDVYCEDLSREFNNG
jgi:LPS sulfotransferase NodH